MILLWDVIHYSHLICKILLTVNRQQVHAMRWIAKAIFAKCVFSKLEYSSPMLKCWSHYLVSSIAHATECLVLLKLCLRLHQLVVWRHTDRAVLYQDTMWHLLVQLAALLFTHGDLARVQLVLSELRRIRYCCVKLCLV